MDEERRTLIRIQTVVTFVALFASLFVILSNKYPDSDLKWAFGMVGLVVGYGLK